MGKEVHGSEKASAGEAGRDLWVCDWELDFTGDENVVGEQSQQHPGCKGWSHRRGL